MFTLDRQTDRQSNSYIPHNLVCGGGGGNNKPNYTGNHFHVLSWYIVNTVDDITITLSYIHTRQPTNPRPMPTNFYSLVGYDRVKNYPLWLKSVSIPDQPPLYPRCIPDAPTLKSRSSRPTPVLPADQSPLCTTNPRPIPDATTLTTLNIGPTPDLMSTPGLKWIIQANVMQTVPEMRTWPILLIKMVYNTS